MAQTTGVGQVPAERVPVPMLVDTDVHESLTSMEELVPYLDENWRRYFLRHARHFPPGVPSSFPYAIPTPNGIAGRSDWLPPDTAVPGSSDLALMQQHVFEGEGVTIGIICGLGTYATLAANHELAMALVAAYNDWQIEHWLDPEPRLRGSVHVVPHDPEWSAREIDRVAAHPQVVQAFLPTLTDRQYGDPFFRPIFEAALRNDLLVALHHTSQTQTVLGWPRYYVEWHTVAAPQAAQNQLLSMICNGLFEAYPELKVAFLETGVGWLPWFMARLDEQYRELRVEVPWVKRLPSQYIKTNVRLSTQPMGDTNAVEFLRIVEACDAAEVFMFATDYPHYDADSPNIVLSTRLPAEIRERVGFRNALESYPRLAGLTPTGTGAA